MISTTTLNDSAPMIEATCRAISAFSCPNRNTTKVTTPKITPQMIRYRTGGWRPNDNKRPNTKVPESAAVTKKTTTTIIETIFISIAPPPGVNTSNDL